MSPTDTESASESTSATPSAAPNPPAGDSLARLVVTLVGVCAVAAAALAGANSLTHARIKAAKDRVKLMGIQRVLPKCVNDPVKDALELAGPKGHKTPIYPCVQVSPGGERKVVAVAVQRDSSTNTHHPYGGTIQVLVGIDAQTGRVRTFRSKGHADVGVVILSLSETPGLGSKSTSYAFRKNFAGRNLVDKDKSQDAQGGPPRVWAPKKDNPNGFVDAISGATITSRAVTEIVHDALATYNQHKPRILSVARKAATGAPRRPAPPHGPAGKE